MKLRPHWNDKVGRTHYEQQCEEACRTKYAVVVFDVLNDELVLLKPDSNLGVFRYVTRERILDEQPVCCGQVAGARKPIDTLNHEHGYLPHDMPHWLWRREMRRALEEYVPNWRQDWNGAKINEDEP